MVRNWISRSKDIHIFKAFDVLLNCCSENLYQFSWIPSAYKRILFLSPQQYWILTLKKSLSGDRWTWNFIVSICISLLSVKMNIYQDFLWMLFSIVCGHHFFISPLSCLTYWLAGSSLYSKLISFFILFNACFFLDYHLH